MKRCNSGGSPGDDWMNAQIEMLTLCSLAIKAVKPTISDLSQSMPQRLDASRLTIPSRMQSRRRHYSLKHNSTHYTVINTKKREIQ